MTPLVQITDLTVSFPLGRRLLGAPPMLKAVKNVSLDIPKGSFVGLVGESGSGKTTLGRAILRAAPISGGSITYDDGTRRFDIKGMSRAEEKAFRAEAQLIFSWEALPMDVAPLIHAHPSFSEAIGEAHLALAGRALHG